MPFDLFFYARGFLRQDEHETGQFRIDTRVGDWPFRSKKMLPTLLQHEKRLRSRTIGIRSSIYKFIKLSSETSHAKQFQFGMKFSAYYELEGQDAQGVPDKCACII